MTQANGQASKRPLDIVIVGGSLGGLCAGVALRQGGHNVTILERTATALLHNQGAGIVAGGDTLEFFEKFDRCGRKIAVSSSRRQYYNRAGEIIHMEEMVGCYACRKGSQAMKIDKRNRLKHRCKT